MAPSSSKHRRGAPPGNQNARKHGFYSSRYPASAQAEGNPPSLDLQAEIDFIRHSMQRVIALGEPQTYREAVDYLCALTLAVTALTRLARTHHYLYPSLDPRDELVREIRQALLEVNAQIESRGSSPAWHIRCQPFNRTLKTESSATSASDSPLRKGG